MSKAIPKECMALLKEASEMFSETGCVPGIDGEQVPPETIVPEAKEYISETIDDPEAIYDPKIWDTSGVCAGPFVAGTKMASKMPQARSLLCSPLRAVFGRTLNEACGLAVRPRLRLDMPKLLSIVPAQHRAATT